MMSPIKQLPSKAHFNDQLTSPRRLCVCVCERERERGRKREGDNIGERRIPVESLIYLNTLALHRSTQWAWIWEFPQVLPFCIYLLMDLRWKDDKRSHRSGLGCPSPPVSHMILSDSLHSAGPQFPTCWSAERDTYRSRSQGCWER